MADKNEFNDEYQFEDLDNLDAEHLSHTEEADTEEGIQHATRREGTNIGRNALIVVALVVILMLGYKFFSSFFSSSKTNREALPQATTQPSSATSVPPFPAPATTIPSTPNLPKPDSSVQPAPQLAAQPSADLSQINQKMASFESNQQELRTELSFVNNKLTSLNSNVNQLTDKIASLNQTLSALASRLEEQSKEITVVMERTKPKAPPRLIVRVPVARRYNIQAIIPGRAWLIATNGSTITVREGTRVIGYGLVKLIDPIQGRVLTSSGRVIRFSQQDS